MYLLVVISTHLIWLGNVNTLCILVSSKYSYILSYGMASHNLLVKDFLWGVYRVLLAGIESWSVIWSSAIGVVEVYFVI